MNEHQQIIDLWKKRSDLARDMGESADNVRQWFHRGNIPAEYWPSLINAAKKRRKKGVTYARLAEGLRKNP